MSLMTGIIKSQLMQLITTSLITPPYTVGRKPLGPEVLVGAPRGPYGLPESIL